MTNNKSITISGIADEAGDTIDQQIKAHKQLGWGAIELRLIDGKNVTYNLPDDDFKRACDKLNEAGLRVTGFGSAIGNWSRPITGDFEVDVQELKVAAKRMNILDTKYIRTMSWLQGEASEADWHKKTIERYKELVKIAEDHGIILAHENCTGWAGLSGENMNQLLDEVESKNLTTLFDIGNTISHGYEPVAFYETVKDKIGYVHIKDCCKNPKGGRSQDYTYPGEGDAGILRVLKDLVSSGYKGVVSIEPHVAKIIHDKDVAPDSTKMYESYIKYARQAEALIQEAQNN